MLPTTLVITTFSERRTRWREPFIPGAVAPETSKGTLPASLAWQQLKFFCIQRTKMKQVGVHRRSAFSGTLAFIGGTLRMQRDNQPPFQAWFPRAQ